MTSTGVKILIALAIAFLSAFALSFVILIGSLLRWFVSRQLTDNRRGHGSDDFQSKPVMLYLTLNLDIVVTFLVGIATQFVNIFYGLVQHLAEYYRLYVVLLLLSIVGYGLTDYTQLVLDVTMEVWNEFIAELLGKVVYPVLDTLRLVYDALIPVWDSLVRLLYFFTIRALTLGLVCSVEDIGDVALEVGAAIYDTAESVSNWVNAGLLTAVYDGKPALRRIGDAFKKAGIVIGCFCKDLEDVYDLVVYPLSNRHFHDSVNNVTNSVLQFTVQQTGIAVRNKTRPNYSRAFRHAVDGALELGDALDDWTNRTFTDIVVLFDEALDPITNETLQPFALPPVWCLISRPVAIVLEGGNLTASFFVNLDQLNPTNADFDPMFRQWDEWGDCAQGAINGTIGMFLLDVDPDLITLGWFVGNTSVAVGEAIKAVGDVVHSSLDVFVILVQEIKGFITGRYPIIYPNGTMISIMGTTPNANVFAALQAYYQDGHIELIVRRVLAVGNSLEAGLIGIYQPIAYTLQSIFVIVAYLFRFFVQFFFYVNVIFSDQAYLRSPAMNSTINDVFYGAGNLSLALGDYLNYIGIQISLLEMNDTYVHGFGGIYYEAAVAFAEYENGLLSSTNPGWINLTAIEYMYFQVQVINVNGPLPCFFTPLFYEAASVPYWGNLLCCAGGTLSDGFLVFLSVVREGVTVLQDAIPPDFGLEITSLINFSQNLENALAVLIARLSCIVGFIDIRGANQCADPESFVTTTEQGCPRAFQSHNRGDRLGNFVNATVQIVLVPLQWATTILDLFNDQFAPCIGVQLFAPSLNAERAGSGESTAQERGACVTAVINSLVVQPMFMVVDALSSLGYYFNCLSFGSGTFVVDGACILQGIVLDLEPVFVEFILMVIDILGFLDDGNPENLYSFLVDSVDFILAVLRAIVTFLWTDIILPLLKPLIDFLFGACRFTQKVIDAVCAGDFLCHKACLSCCNIYSSVLSTTGDPTSFVNGTFNNFTFGIPPSQPPIPSAFVSYVPNLFSASASPAPPSPSSSPLMMMMMRRRGDGDTEEGGGEEEGGDAGPGDDPPGPSPDAREDTWEWMMGSGHGHRKRHDGDYRYRQTRFGGSGSGSGITPAQCLIAYPDVDCVEDDSSSSSGSSSSSASSSAIVSLARRVFGVGSGVEDDGTPSRPVPPLAYHGERERRGMTYAEILERVRASGGGGTSDKPERAEEKGKRYVGLFSENYPDDRDVFDQEDVFRHGMDDAGHNRYFHRTFDSEQGTDHEGCNEPYFFSTENFPDLYYDVRGLDNRTLHRVDVSMASAFEAHVDTRGWYRRSSNATKEIVSRSGWVLERLWAVGKKAVNEFERRDMRKKYARMVHPVVHNANHSGPRHPFQPTDYRRFPELLATVVREDFFRNIGKGAHKLASKVKVLHRAMDRFMGDRLGSAWSGEEGVPVNHDTLIGLKVRERRAVAPDGAIPASQVPAIAIDILTNCTFLEDFILATLQQACSLQKYFNATSGPFNTKLGAFKAWFKDPYNYTGTPENVGYGKYECSYLTSFEQDFAFNREPIPFPDLRRFEKRFNASLPGTACNNTDAFSLNCWLRDFLLRFNLNMDVVIHQVARFLFRPNSEKGFAYFVDSLVNCNYGPNLECRKDRGLGLADAFLIVYGVLLGLTLFSAYVYPLPGIVLGLLWMFSWVFLLNLAYAWSPFCFPALPYCFGDNVFDEAVRIFPVCFSPPACLVKETSPPLLGGNCDNYTFYEADTDLGIHDGLQNIAILLNWASPSFVEWFMTSKLTYYLYHIPFVKDNLDRYFYGGAGPPEKYVCGALLTLPNVALPIMLLLLLSVFSMELFDLISVIVVFVFTLFINIVIFYREVTNQAYFALYSNGAWSNDL